MYQRRIKKVGCYLNDSPFGDMIINRIAKTIQSPVYHAKNGLQSGLIFSWGILRGGENIIRQAMDQKRDFYYIDHAYFNAGHNQKNPPYRIVKNELQLTKVYRRPSDRFDQLGIEIKPWRKSGDYILVCPPSPASANFYQLNNSWTEKVITILQQITDMPIHVRYKPNVVGVDISTGVAIPVQNKENYPEDTLSLAEHFENAYCVITYNSMVGIQAVCAGVPVIVSQISAAYPVGRTKLTDIYDLFYPKREEWLYSLAYSQFTLSEIESGRAFEILDI